MNEMAVQQVLKKIKAFKNIKARAQAMTEQAKAHPQGSKLMKNWFWVTVGMIALYTCGAVYEQSTQLAMIDEERAVVMRKIEEEKATQKRLREECEKLKEPAYIEQVAREELGFVKEGEIPYISREKKTH